MCAAVLKKWKEAATLILVHGTIKPKLSEAQEAFQKIIRPSIKNIDKELLDDNLGVLVLRKQVPFLTDLYSFPGGPADNADFSTDWLRIFRAVTPQGDNFKNNRFGYPTNMEVGRSSLFTRQRKPEFSEIPGDVGLRIAAIRETFEESGILIARSADMNSYQHNPSLASPYPLSNFDVDMVNKWRSKVINDKGAFLTMCEKFDIVPDIWSLYNWSNWLTPPVFLDQEEPTPGNKNKGLKKASRYDEHESGGESFSAAKNLLAEMTVQNPSMDNSHLNPVQMSTGPYECPDETDLRFDAAFFVCVLRDLPAVIQEKTWSPVAHWVRPKTTIELYNNKVIQLHPLHLYEMSRMMNFHCPLKLHKFLFEQAKIGPFVERWMPMPIICKDAIIFAFPGDSLYPESPDHENAKPIFKPSDSLKGLTENVNNIHRAVTSYEMIDGEMVSSGRYTLQCNVPLPKGHVAPIWR